MLKLSFEIKDNRIIQEQLIKGLILENGSKASLALDFAEKQIDLSFYFG